MSLTTTMLDELKLFGPGVDLLIDGYADDINCPVCGNKTPFANECPWLVSGHHHPDKHQCTVCPFPEGHSRACRADPEGCPGCHRRPDDDHAFGCPTLAGVCTTCKHHGGKHHFRCLTHPSKCLGCAQHKPGCHDYGCKFHSTDCSGCSLFIGTDDHPNAVWCR